MGYLESESNGNTSFDYQKHSSVLPTTIYLYGVLTWLLITFSMVYTKHIYTSLTIWEDIYGRCLIGTFVSFVYMSFADTSAFEISTSIRTKLFLMQLLFMLSFVLIMVSTNNLNILSVIAILLTFYTTRDQLIGLNGL